MAKIELRQVEKRFGDLQAVKPMNLTVKDGEFVVFLGPSGCGKTTTLRMISGLEAVTDGQIFVGDRDVTWAHPSDRDIAFVFQLYALYPHMSVYENIAFPLEAENIPEDEIRKRVRQVVDILEIDHLLEVQPRGLSGGDKQRVALARALVRQPEAFLMDEPIGALDADLREYMRAEIKQLHIRENATTIYVTHDQVEAMAMGDRIVVMSAAEVQQVGTPAEVYYNPANMFVARFIGSPGMNLVTGKYQDGTVYLPGDNRYEVREEWRAPLAEQLSGDDAILGFRPEAATISEDGVFTSEVYADELYGSYTIAHLALNGAEESIVDVRADRHLQLPIGTPARFDINPEMVRFFDPVTEKAILRSHTTEVRSG